MPTALLGQGDDWGGRARPRRQKDTTPRWAVRDHGAKRLLPASSQVAVRSAPLLLLGCRPWGDDHRV
jgi:hypothetical protein